MTLVEKAYTFSKEKHEGQFRRDNITPYFSHCEKVALLVESDIEKILAYLHDTVEDNRCSIEDVQTNFGEDVTNYIYKLTHHREDSYEYYIRKFNDMNNKLVKRVKIADIVANLTDSPTEKQIDKYYKALVILST